MCYFICIDEFGINLLNCLTKDYSKSDTLKPSKIAVLFWSITSQFIEMQSRSHSHFELIRLTSLYAFYDMQNTFGKEVHWI